MLIACSCKRRYFYMGDWNQRSHEQPTHAEILNLKQRSRRCKWVLHHPTSLGDPVCDTAINGPRRDVGEVGMVSVSGPDCADHKQKATKLMIALMEALVE